MSSQLPGIGITSCFTNADCDWGEAVNTNFNLLNADSVQCVTAGADTIVNTAAAFDPPAPGDAYVDTAGCLIVYHGPDKGWQTVPAKCGRTVYDPAAKKTWIWDDGTWKELIVCQTVTGSSITNKSTSTLPSGTLGYNDSSNPYVEFITINGQWVETGRLFDPLTCDYYECEDASSIFFTEATSTVDPLKPDTVTGVPAGKYSVIPFGDNLFVQSSTGTPVKLANIADTLIRCFADDAAANAGFPALCIDLDDGLTYFDTTLNTLKIYKAGVWVDLNPDPVTTDTYTDNTQAGTIVDLNSDGLLDPCFTNKYPSVETAADWVTKYGAPTGGERRYVPSTGRVLVYDAVLGQWRDEAEAEPMECFIVRHVNTDVNPVGGGAINVWQTVPLNDVTATASYVTDLGGSQYQLQGGCCYRLDYSGMSYRMGGHMLRIFDVTNGVDAGGNGGIGTVSGGSQSIGTVTSVNTTSSDSATAIGCVEFCPTTDVTIELQFYKQAGGTNNLIARAPINGISQVGSKLSIKKLRAI